MKTLCIVSPCYNEEEVIRWSANKLSELIVSLTEKGKISSNSFVLYVNDGSKDKTWEILESIYKENPLINAIDLTRNVGHQRAIMAGMMTAKEMSDMVVTIDADLQDDLNAIEKMIDAHYEGNEIVYGVKVEREADPIVKRLTAKAFYKMQHLMDIDTVYNHADFRLMSKKALEQLSLFEERNVYLRGIIPMLGLKSAKVDDVIKKREAGKSKYTISKMLSLAIDGITSFSSKPIQLITWSGILMMISSLIIFVYVISSYIKHNVIPGWTSLMLSVWFIGSLILISIGIVGEYIGKIYIEVKRRPLYSIDKRLIRTNKEKSNNN